MTTLAEAREITRWAMPTADIPDDLAYEDDTYWLVPAYVPDDELAPDSYVPVVRKSDGEVEWLLPHLPPVTKMGEVAPQR
jgi:hypothetical protein